WTSGQLRTLEARDVRPHHHELRELDLAAHARPQRLVEPLGAHRAIRASPCPEVAPTPFRVVHEGKVVDEDAPAVRTGLEADVEVVAVELGRQVLVEP